ncbi:hypothetical protein C0992_009715 [Termitomyces sp. T32_za158]|nr:hypothetical protein C0992_009715 [Termitomyces sp. T32_za158]
MAYQGQPKPGQSSQHSGWGGRPAQGQICNQPQLRTQQYAAVAYPGHEEPLPYQTPVHSQMDVDEEGHYECQDKKVRHKRVHHPGLSWPQGGVQSYARTVAQPLVEEYAPQAQMSMGTEMLLGCLEAVGQPVPTTASFLQDNHAVMVMEGLLDQIKLMRRQRVTALKQIDRAAKRKLPGYEGSTVILTTSLLPAQPPAAPVQAAPTIAQAPKVPLAELLLEQQDEEMLDAPLNWNKMALLDAIEAGACTHISVLQAAGPSN